MATDFLNDVRREIEGRTVRKADLLPRRPMPAETARQ